MSWHKPSRGKLKLNHEPDVQVKNHNTVSNPNPKMKIYAILRSYIVKVKVSLRPGLASFSRIEFDFNTKGKKVGLRRDIF